LKKNQVKPGPLRQQRHFINKDEPDYTVPATPKAAVFPLHFSAGT